MMMMMMECLLEQNLFDDKQFKEFTSTIQVIGKFSCLIPLFSSIPHKINLNKIIIEVKLSKTVSLVSPQISWPKLMPGWGRGREEN